MKRFLLALGLMLCAGAANAQAVVVSACGAKTFAVGSQNYVTMNPQGYLCVSTTTTVVVTTTAPPPSQPAPEPNRREEK